MRYFILISLILLSSTRIQAQIVHNFELEDPEGNLHLYETIKGSELTIIDFWATWCKPCVNSIPKIVQLSEEFNPEQIAFVGISIDSPRNRSKIRPFANSVGINYPILVDTDQELSRDLNITVIPTLLIINKQGKIIYSHEGFAPGDEILLKEEIEKNSYDH